MTKVRRAPTAAILLSRQSLRPVSDCPWVHASVEAVRWVRSSGYSLWTSVGMQTWELLAVVAADEGVHQTVVVPAVDEEEFATKQEYYAAQLDLSEDKCSFIPHIPPDSSSRRTRDLMRGRDRTIVRQATTLIPVSLRKGGSMEQLVLSHRQTGDRSIVDTFGVGYDHRRRPLCYRVPQENIGSPIRNTKERYVIHWTRSSNTAWPTERLTDYYHDILRSEAYPRDAFATLRNILASRQIVASSRHMPGSTPTVSLSARAPHEFAALMRWRARYREMSFEPYGIGIKRETAAECGIRPVQYWSKESGATRAEPWLGQSSGKITNWNHEEEWRAPGDLDLSQVPTDHLACFCYTELEAARLRQEFGLTSYAFTDAAA